MEPLSTKGCRRAAGGALWGHVVDPEAAGGGRHHYLSLRSQGMSLAKETSMTQGRAS